MRWLPRLAWAAVLTLAGCEALRVQAGRPASLIADVDKRAGPLQDIVTWDERSLFIRGERVMIFAGEFHPFRLPVPSLYLDVFQKIRALGYNAVSFYVDWALLEGKPGNFSAEGVFALEPFFDAALNAGIFLIARPGPYINAEVSGGGFPGWLQNVRGMLRTAAPDYLAATENYMANICKIIARGQITNGGPIILFQPENEYSATYNTPFDNNYMQYVADQARRAGVVVPLINNDAWPSGHNAPGSGTGSMDIYGHDGYPLGFDCAHPYTWPSGNLPNDYRAQHVAQSPHTPYSILEFQGGSYDPWGGWGFEQCSVLVNHEFQRVFYKNNLAAGVTIFSIYMTYGGTNWGNLGHPGGYTSYDYGAVIREDRTVNREKYSEAKLQAQFISASPGYLLAVPFSRTTGNYSTNVQVTITPLLGNGTGSFFVVRHTDYTNIGFTTYTLDLPTSAGIIHIPQLGNASLLLNGRDSKIHITDYPVGNYTLLYSTAEVLTWKKFDGKSVLVVYGAIPETHELAIISSLAPVLVEGNGVAMETKNGTQVLQWETSLERKVVKLGDHYIYILNRNSAYNYWVPTLPGSGTHPAYGSSLMNPEALIVNGGYLVRSAAVLGSSLSIKADFNETTTLEIIGVPNGVSKVLINGQEMDATTNSLGNWIVKPPVPYIKLAVPELSKLSWKYIDGLPEIQAGYDDSTWPAASKKNTNNSIIQQRTPTSLFGSDYGFHTGPLVFRGHFTANGTEESLFISTIGGNAFGHSVWINDTFVGSFNGYDAAYWTSQTYVLPKLVTGASYVLTVLVDHSGLNENWTPGTDDMKLPRGILNYAVTSSAAGSGEAQISWRLTGNFGGEDGHDRFRGPLNEGGLSFERQGYHLPSPPLDKFAPGSPFDGISKPGVAFYVAPLNLSYNPDRFDIPISFTFDNTTGKGGNDGAYRALLYVNGFQFGKYVSNIGPQTDFPVPEGILNYRGENWIGLAVWATEPRGARVPDFYLTVKTPVVTGREKVVVVEGPKYSPRQGTY